MYALTVALKNRAERRVIRCVCVAMLVSFERVSLGVCAVIPCHTLRVSAYECTALEPTHLDDNQTIL